MKKDRTGNKATPFLQKCQFCGKDFDTYKSSKRKYCSRNCYFEIERGRKAIIVENNIYKIVHIHLISKFYIWLLGRIEESKKIKKNEKYTYALLDIKKMCQRIDPLLSLLK